MTDEIQEAREQYDDEKFNQLVQEVMAVFAKHNPPLQVAVSGTFVVISEVAFNTGITKESLMEQLSVTYDAVYDVKKRQLDALHPQESTEEA